MIQPRKSDGIVDLADLFPTALDLAGHPGAKVANLVPKTTFIDGVDQTSFFREQMVSLTVRPSTTSSMVNFLLCVWMSSSITS